MTQGNILVIQAFLSCISFAQQATGQAVPRADILQTLTSQARFMTQVSYRRWQYCIQNNMRINQVKAGE